MHTRQHKPTAHPANPAQVAPEHARQRGHLARLPAWSGALALRPKLTVNAPGDAFEQEADQAAERVMRMAEPAVQREPCAGCPDEEPQAVQMKAQGGTNTPAAPDSVHSAIRRAGQPLDAGTRAFMEPRFGQDFGGVRVHTDSQAAQSAAEIGARAYTVGRDVVFGAGQYTPGTHEGRSLIAHELAHTMQQGGGPSPVGVQRQLFPPMPIIVNPPRTSAPVVVNAVDDRQEESTDWYLPWRYTGPLASLFRGDVTMTDINSMVTNVIAHLNGRRMHRLNIMDHGNASGVQIGDDWLANAADVARFSGTLGRLSSHFASGAIVHMQNCEAGQNQDLICALAAAFGVTVYAGTGLQNPVLGFNLGEYVSCTPGGTFNPNAGRPSTPTPPPPPDPNQMA